MMNLPAITARGHKNYPIYFMKNCKTSLNLRRTHRATDLFALALGLVISLRADPPQFQPPQVLQANGTNLGANVFSFATPCVTDWNGDGKKDLLVGYQIAGKIALFINSGTDAEPVFTDFQNLQFYDPNHGWQDILHPSGGCGAPAPWVCDFDADGKRDLLVGAGHDGTVWFYRNTNTDAEPRLVSQGQLKVGSDILTVSSRANPCFYDWDEDGLPDLLCGAGDGYVYFFKNTNTLQAPIFAPKVRIQAGERDLFLGIRSVVRVDDWDGDGLKDLVCSSDTGVYWCRSTNFIRQPMLQAPVSLCAPAVGIGLTNIITGPVPGARMRVFPVDWNHDRVIDFLLGNADGTVYFYEGYQFAFNQVTPLPGAQLVLQWSSAPYLKYHVLANESPINLQYLVATNLPSSGKTTSWTNAFNGNAQFYKLQIAP
jgi:hypothetical protein